MIQADHAIIGVHAKGGCYICGSPNNLVDTEVGIAYEGILAICKGCVRDIAMTAGFDLEHSNRQWEKLTEEHAEATYIAGSLLDAIESVRKTATDVSRKHQGRLKAWRNRRSEGAKRREAAKAAPPSVTEVATDALIEEVQADD